MKKTLSKQEIKEMFATPTKKQDKTSRKAFNQIAWKTK